MKRFYILLLLILPTLSWSQVDLKNGLVACYPFNANAKDESGNGNNGTLNGAALTTDRFGKTNAAYNFDGNSYIALPSDKFAFQNYSYSVWLYVSSLPADGDTFRALSIGGACGDQNIDISNNYYGNTGIDGGGYDIATGNATVSGGAVGTLPTIGKWYHVAITRDNNNVKLYVDGILINTYTTSGKLPYYGCSGKTLANIGTRSNVVQSFTGKVDDVHLYNRPLNVAEVKALFDGNSAPTVTISADKSAPCGGDKIIFTVNGAYTTAKYQWKVDGVNAGTDSKTLAFNAPNKLSDYQVKISVEIMDEDVCFPKKPVLIDKIVAIKNCVVPPSNTGNKILIPTAFTPNGDGTNDVWELLSLAGNNEVIIEIYNRWGEIVFYSKGYSEPWNGTYKGSPVIEGTYAYIIRVDAEKVYRGAVLVVR